MVARVVKAPCGRRSERLPSAPSTRFALSVMALALIGGMCLGIWLAR